MTDPAAPKAGPENQARRHLDLGCGGKPRNPYLQAAVFGIDLSDQPPIGETAIRQANLALDPIPFPDSHFASVSAYDFLEHMPRVLPTAGPPGTRFPFVELMDEIWRVLEPGGLFYAQTPAYPHPAAFQDPTHVNILTDQSHLYFTRPHLLASVYGFRGTFDAVRILRVLPEFDREPEDPDWNRRRRMRRRERRGEASHLIWELRAVK